MSSNKIQDLINAELDEVNAHSRASFDEVADDISSGKAVDDFIAFVREHGINEFGYKARFDGNYVEEVLRLVGDFRIQTVITSGCSQLVKTYANAQVNAYYTQIKGLRSGWAFATADMRESLVPKQHSKILKHYARLGGSTKILTSNTKDFASDAGGNITFAHLNSKSSGSGGAEAGAGLVSFTADFLVNEEASQSSEKATKPLYRRGDASNLGQRFDMAAPYRPLGTPGNGAGIEREMRDAHFEFWPHTICGSCKQVISLHPLGALLKPVKIRDEDGTLVEKYTDASGMPIDWHHHDPDHKKDSAFFGCPKCGAEIPDKLRFKARFRCIKTGMWLKRFLSDYLPKTWIEKSLRVGIWCGALLRHKNGRKEAAAIMNEVKSPEGMKDFFQQRLGIPSTETANNIPPESITKAINRPLWRPTFSKQGQNLREVSDDNRVVLAGIDQGRAANYATFVEFVWPKGISGAMAEQNAKRNILFMKDVHSLEIPGLMDRFKASGGFIDNEPSISSAAKMARTTGLLLADQKPKQTMDFKEIVVIDGGETFPAFGIKYLKWVKNIFSQFAMNKYSISDHYRWQEFDQSNPATIYRHLTGVAWDPEEGTIERDSAKIDDLFFALMFAEAAFSLYLVSPHIVGYRSNDKSWWSRW